MDLANEFTALVEAWGYAAILAGSFIDGAASVALGGAAAAQGLLGLPGVIVVAMLMNWAWDQFYFHLGRRHGPAITRRSARVAAGVRHARRWITGHQALLIMSTRFVIGFRIAGPVALGVLGVRPAVYAMYSAIGALAWAVLLSLGGYLGALGIDALASHGLSGGVVAALVVAVFVAGGIVIARRQIHRGALAPQQAG